MQHNSGVPVPHPKAMNPIRRFLAALAAATAALVALDAPAATQYSPDYTDAWQVPGEAGYGFFVNQQGATIFLAIFVYGGDTLPRWYFASGLTPTSTTNFTGPLYRTQGTSFNAPWNPASLQVIPVGTATLTFASPTSGSITYTVDGIVVTKALVRNSLPRNNLAGTFIGAISTRTSGCTVASNTPTLATFGESFTITDDGIASPRFVMNFGLATGALASCTFTGTYAVSGRMGNIDNGSWTCSGVANAGTFSMSEIQVSQNSFSAKISMRDQFCQSYVGYIGGVRAAE